MNFIILYNISLYLKRVKTYILWMTDKIWQKLFKWNTFLYKYNNEELVEFLK